MNDLIKLFSRNNLKILKALDDANNLYIREIAEKVNSSPASVYHGVELFQKLGIVIEKRIKNRRVLSLNRRSLMLRKLKSLINLYELTNHEGFKELKKHGSVGVYGSFATGEDAPGSDIDLWIYSDAGLKSAKLREITRSIEKDLGKEVKLLILTKRKIQGLKETDPEFYNRLKLTSVVLDGDVFDWRE